MPAPTAVSVVALHVSIPVLDLEQAESFYRSALGAVTVSGDASLVVMDLQGHRIALRKVRGGSSSLQKGGRDGLRARHFGFAVANPDEVDGAVAGLTALGAELVVSPADREDGRSAIFCDHSGNQIEIYCERLRRGQTV